ncbi:MAG: penicillin-binding transpeptidase domain-containing protein [Dehalococcoidia bacterium]
MTLLRLSLIIVASFLIVACSRQKPESEVAVLPEATPARPTADDVVRQYLLLWSGGQYDTMYDLLSAGSRQAIARERFISRHEDIADEARITTVAAAPAGSAQVSGDRAEAVFTVTYATSLWGDIRQDNVLPLILEGDDWRVEWAPALIFKELKGANLVRTVIDTPSRGAILDRNGTPIAVTGSVPTIGTAKNLINVPGIVQDRNGLIAYLAQKLEIPEQEIRAKVDDPQAQIDVFIPLKTLPPNAPPELVSELEGTAGVVVQRTPRRVYPHGAALAHVVGYVAPITAEQLQQLRGEGYQQGDLVGGLGLEASMEEQLAGQRGARLTIITPEGGLVAELAKRPGRPAQDIVTTIDVSAQLALVGALGERVGSAVLLDPRDNSVVAMASYPAFDPNAWVTGISADAAGQLLGDPRTPLLNRAIAATYPPGSTFKVITAAAGLERAGYTASSRVECTPVWYGLGQNTPKRNWTTVNEGPLTIAEGLMRSCNPVFYDIGLKIDGIDPRILTEFAKGFGFGSQTGLNGLEDAAGVAPGPEWKQQNVNEGWFSGDTVNMSIGQGFLLTTPLQIANAYSAIAANGVRRTPVLVKETREAGTNTVIESFTAKETGRLPVSPATLDVIKRGTTMVVQDPRGTANYAFAGSRLDAAGKSGSAEDRGEQTHALFVSYAPRTNARGVAIVVLDDGNSGSLEAAPIVRRILESWVLR